MRNKLFKIANTLFQYEKELQNRNISKKVQFTQDKNANNFLLNSSFAFLIAVICDQGINAERVWALPYYLSRRIGHFDIKRIAQMKVTDLGKIMRKPPALHRFNNIMAKNIILAAQRVLKFYNGNTCFVWQGIINSREIYRRFSEFEGIGQKKGTMAVNILVRDLKVKVTDLQNIDISYDVHIRRVFLRTGIVNKDTEQAVINRARELNPLYPGKFDLPAWMVGRNWCHPSNPLCELCRLGNVCPKRISLSVKTY